MPKMRNKIQCRILKCAMNTRKIEIPPESYCFRQLFVLVFSYKSSLLLKFKEVEIFKPQNQRSRSFEVYSGTNKLFCSFTKAGCAYAVVDSCLIPCLGPLRKETVQCPKVALSCLTSFWNALIAL